MAVQSKGGTHMAKKIQDNCITCGRCEQTCPLGCVFPGPKHYEIDSKRCVSCGRCATYCPVGAIAEVETEEAMPL